MTAQEVVIHLRNQDRLSGRILEETSEKLRLRTSLLGDLEIPLREIARRETPVPTAAPSAAAATSPSPAPAPIVPAIPATPPLAAPATNNPAGPDSAKTLPKKAEPGPPVTPANPEASSIASTPKFWKHDVRLGLNLRYTSRDTRELFAVYKSTYGKPPLRHIFDLNFRYGRTEGTLAANSLAGSEKTEYQLTPKLYGFGLVGGGYDEVRRIDGQYELGPGLGVELLKKNTFVWKSEFGFTFRDQFLGDDTRHTDYSARVAEIFAWRVWKNLVADAKIEVFPNLKEFGEYRLRLESTLRYPISELLSLNLDVINLYDSQPPKNVIPNDLQIRSSVGLTF